MASIGILGGSFNPLHLAHLIVAERVRGERGLDRVLFIPAAQPPHKPRQCLAPAADRLKMVRLAIRDNPAFTVDPLELEREGPSYTLTTVRELQQRLGARDRLCLLLGADSVLDLENWWRADELAHAVDIVAFNRPGHPLDGEWEELGRRFGRHWAERLRRSRVQVPQLDISATEIRERVRRGLSIRYLVPEPVRCHIEEQGLYRGS